MSSSIHDTGRPTKRLVLRKIEPSADTSANGAAMGSVPPMRPRQPSHVPLDELSAPLPIVRPETALTATLAQVASPIAGPRQTARMRLPSAADIAAYAATVASAEPPEVAQSQPFLSVPPVVASVAPSDFPPALVAPSTTSSTLKAVLIGAGLGLALVSAFVAGTRLATNASTPPFAVAAGVPAPAQPLRPASEADRSPAASQVQTAAPPAASKAAEPPTISATQLPMARAVPRKPKAAPKASSEASANAPAGTVAGSAVGASPSNQKPSEAPAKDKDSTEAPSDETTSPAAAAPAAAAPTAMDPFLKAVQAEIDEDTAKGR